MGFQGYAAAITTFVFTDKASSSIVTSIVYCGIAISINTGSPILNYDVTAVGNPAATVIVSSPSFTRRPPNSGNVNAIKAHKFIDKPKFTRVQ